MYLYSQGTKQKATHVVKGKTKYLLKKKKPITLTKEIKKVQLRQCEPKRSTQYTLGQTLYHNLSWYKTNLIATTQGVEQGAGMNTWQHNRVGNEIFAQSITFKFHYLTAVGRPNSLLQIKIFGYNSQEVMSDAIFWRGPSGDGADMARTVDSPDTNQVTILKSRTIQHQPNYSEANSRVCGTLISFKVNLKNRRVKYDNEGNIPKFKDIAIMAVAYDANNTTELDILGYLSVTSTLNFKDP